MKSEFSTSWRASSQVRKQRKFRHNAPLHVKQKLVSANLSKELRKKHGMRSLSVRKDDEVLVMRGSFAKKKGKVISVNLKRGKIAVEGLTKKKKDGTAVQLMIYPSNVQIQGLNMNDKRRLEVKKEGGKQ